MRSWQNKIKLPVTTIFSASITLPFFFTMIYMPMGLLEKYKQNVHAIHIKGRKEELLTLGKNRGIDTQLRDYCFGP